MIVLLVNLGLLTGLLVLAALSLLRAGKVSPATDGWLGIVAAGTVGLMLLASVLVNNVLVVMILVVWGVVRAARLGAERDSLLWTLTLSVEQGLPLGSGAHAFASECRGAYRQQVLKLARLLSEGAPLAEALSVMPRVVSEEAALAARVGSEAGTLARALRDVAERRAYRTPLWYTFGLRLLYLFGVMLFTQSVLLFAMLFIVPKLQRITSDFGVRLIGLAGALLDASDWFADHWIGCSSVLLLQGGMILYLLLWVMGWTTWELPLVRMLFRRLDVAMALRMLALSIEAGKPLLEPLESLSRSFPRWAIRRRLARVANDVRAGEPLEQSLQRRRLVDRRERAVLEAAARAGNLAWALREVAESGERRFGYRLHAWSQVLYPVCVLLAALPIGLTAAAFLLPMIEVLRGIA